MKPTPEQSNVLLANPWFAGLPAAVRGALVSGSELVRLRPGEMLFRQGDAADERGSGFYALLSGALKSSSLREDGREAILVVLEPGNWFGEISMLDGLPRTHDTTAMQECEVAVLPRAAFESLMQRPAFSQAVAQLMAARLRGLFALMEDATLRSLQSRVARRLLMLARGDATQAHDFRPSVQVSQEALAMMLGISRQTLSKELKVLAQAGAIALGYGVIGIASVEKLKAAGARS
ncbi:MAG: Crp/Fnr family transcriptional regulator [Burkholderiaceae bacterium]